MESGNSEENVEEEMTSQHLFHSSSPQYRAVGPPPRRQPHEANPDQQQHQGRVGGKNNSNSNQYQTPPSFRHLVVRNHEIHCMMLLNQYHRRNHHRFHQVAHHNVPSQVPLVVHAVVQQYCHIVVYYIYIFIRGERAI